MVNTRLKRSKQSVYKHSLKCQIKHRRQVLLINVCYKLGIIIPQTGIFAVYRSCSAIPIWLSSVIGTIPLELLIIGCAYCAVSIIGLATYGWCRLRATMWAAVVLWPWMLALRWDHVSCHCGDIMWATIGLIPCGLPLQWHHVSCHCGDIMWATIAVTPCGLPLRWHHVGYHCSDTMWATIAVTPCGLPLRWHHVGYHCGDTMWATIAVTPCGLPLDTRACTHTRTHDPACVGRTAFLFTSRGDGYHNCWSFLLIISLWRVYLPAQFGNCMVALPVQFGNCMVALPVQFGNCIVALPAQ